jgi:hypothetical protein
MGKISSIAVRLVSILLLVFYVHTVTAQEYRKFTAADGSFSGMAALVNLEKDRTGAEVAVLKRQADGRVVKVILSRLSPEDIAWVESERAVLSVPEVMRSRMTLENRVRLRKESGSDPSAEVAVEAALSWLSGRQNQDGSWGASNKAAMTGLALLAMAGNGHGPLSPVYADPVKRGTAFLTDLAARNAAPFTGVFSDRPALITSTYEHAIGTQALSEIYALTPRSAENVAGLKSAVENALGIIVKKQNPQGAWAYKDGIGYDPLGATDLSVSCWQIHALWACRTAGLQREGMPAAIAKAAKYLESTRSTDGGFGKPDRASHYNQWNLSGGALSGYFEVKPNNLTRADPIAQSVVRWMTGELKKEPLDWTKGCYLYTWYFNSMALHKAGGEAWELWRKQCEPILKANQLPNGSWKPETVGEIAAAGTSAAAADNDIYRTCLATLILETPVRYDKAKGK